MSQYHVEFPVVIFFHLYRHNLNDVKLVQQLCDDLGFILSLDIAYFGTIEKKVKLLRDGRRSLSVQDNELLSLLLITPEEIHQIKEWCREDYNDCVLRQRQMAINFDGSVALCCGTYTLPNVVNDFLAIPFAEIQQKKYADTFCAECLSLKLATPDYAVESDAMAKRLAAKRMFESAGIKWDV